jgi:hypothetical protein
MKNVILVLFIIFTNAFAKEKVDRLGFGKYYLGFEYGKGQSTVLHDYELPSTYTYYSVKLVKQVFLSNSFGIDGGIGYLQYQGQLRYTEDSEYLDMDYKQGSVFFVINPLYNLTDRILVGLTWSVFPRPIELSTTELALNKYGANIYIDKFLLQNVRFGLFFDKTDGLTRRGITITGASLQVGF